LLATIEDLRELGSESYRVLLTMIPPAPSKEGLDVQAYLRGEGIPVFSGMIRRYAAYSKAALAGVLVRDARDPRAGIAWSDYVAVGREIL